MHALLCVRDLLLAIRGIVRTRCCRFGTTGNSQMPAMRKLPVVLFCRRRARLCRRANQVHSFGRPARTMRGASRSSRTWRGMRWTLAHQLTSDAAATAKACGPDPPMLGSSCRVMIPAATVAKEARHTEESAP